MSTHADFLARLITCSTCGKQGEVEKECVYSLDHGPHACVAWADEQN